MNWRRVVDFFNGYHKVVFFAVLTLAIFTHSVAVHAAPSIPYKINFQGRLTNTDGNIVPNGLYNLRFKIMNAPSGGTELWSETRQAASRVQITNGLFDVRLGDVSALSPTIFNSTTQLYLEVELPSPATATCAAAACASYTEGPLSPRQPIAASPYAFNADMIDGIDGTQLARVDQANTFNGNQTVAGTLTATNILQGTNQVCDISNNCNYGSAVGGSGYIQNQTATPQVAGFSISGNGTIGGSLLVQGGISSPGAGANSEVFGLGALAGVNSVSIGSAASAGNDAVTIGRGAVSANGHVVIGYGATNSVSLGDGVTIGKGSVGSSRCVTIGGAASSTAGSYCVAVGYGATTVGSSVAIGSGAKALASGGIAIGYEAYSNNGNSIAIGRGATATSGGQLVVGSSSYAVTQSFIGNGVTNASPQGFTLNATGGEGADIQGANLTLAGGRGTGAGSGGNILFTTSAPGATGTALRNLVTRAQINGGSGTMSIGTTSDLGQLGVVTNSTSRVGLVIRGSAGQSADLLQLQNSAGSKLLGFRSSGAIESASQLDIYTNGFASATLSVGSLFSTPMVAINGITHVTAPSATSNGLIVKAGASQTADIAVFHNAANTVMSGVRADGRMFGPDGSDSTDYVNVGQFLGLTGILHTQGGNSFGGNAVIGTGDNYGVDIVANGGVVSHFSTTGDLLVAQSFDAQLGSIKTGGATRISNTGALQNVTADTSILTTGTLNDARLSGNVALKGASNTFAGQQIFQNGISVTNYTLLGGYAHVGAWTADDVQLYVQSSTVGTVAQRIQGASGQTADLLQVQNSAGLDHLRVSQNGTLYVQPVSGASSIIVRDSDGNNAFVVDATGKILLGKGGTYFTGLKRITTTWNPPSTANASTSLSQYTLPTGAVVVGVVPPTPPTCAGGFGCTYSSGGALLDNRGGGQYTGGGSSSQIVQFVFANATGAAVDPPTGTWIIWYIDP